MGYRGKLAEQQQARQLRRTGLPLAEIAARLDVSKSSVSLWVRDVEFTPLPRPPRGRRRDPTPSSAASGPISTGWWRRGGSGSASCRSGSSWSLGWRCTRGREQAGRRGEVRQQRPSDDHVLLRLDSAVLRDRREAAPGAAVPARRARTGCLGCLLIEGHRDPAVSVPEAVPGGPRPEHSAHQACAWLREHRLQLLRDPPQYHGARSRAPWRRCHSGVAQSAEQRPVKPFVASSSLAPGAWHLARDPPVAGRFIGQPAPRPGARTALVRGRTGAGSARSPRPGWAGSWTAG
jgi:hypothetical protein